MAAIVAASSGSLWAAHKKVGSDSIPRRLQLNASSLSCPRSPQRSHRKPWARMPHSRKASNSSFRERGSAPSVPKRLAPCKAERQGRFSGRGLVGETLARGRHRVWPGYARLAEAAAWPSGCRHASALRPRTYGSNQLGQALMIQAEPSRGSLSSWLRDCYAANDPLPDEFLADRTDTPPEERYGS